AEALDTCCALDHGSDPPAIRPEHVLANRGELNLRRSDLAAAAAAFQAARALDPASSYLCERLGRVHELAGDPAAAEAAYREAAALPRGAFAYLALGRCHARVTGDLPAAVAALVEALRQVPAAEPLVRVELARVELAVGRRAAALRHVERALACRREGGFAEGLRLAAELCEQLGRAADARRYLEQLARLAPADAEIAARAAALAAAPGSERPPSPPDPPLPPALAALAHAAVEAPGGERLPAIVDRFFPEKGFGFLRYGDGESIFFHVTQCEEGRDAIVIRFAGDSGDGMQVTGTQFTTESALAGNDLATLPDFPAEIRAPAGTLAGVSAFQLNFSSLPVFTPGDDLDVLVAMNPAA